MPAYPDPDDFDDGDHINALDAPEPSDGYQPPPDPEAEPVEDGEPA